MKSKFKWMLVGPVCFIICCAITAIGIELPVSFFAFLMVWLGGCGVAGSLGLIVYGLDRADVFSYIWLWMNRDD